MIPVIVETEAIDDIDAIARRMAADNLQAGLEFYDAIANTCDLLGHMPMAGTRRSATDRSLDGLRSYGVIRHRTYLIFFVPSRTAVRVVRVLHGATDVDRTMGPPT